MTNAMQNGRRTLPNVANAMQNAKWPCQNVANTIQNDRFEFQTVANARQMVPGKKAKKQSKSWGKRNNYQKLFYTLIVRRWVLFPGGACDRTLSWHRSTPEPASHRKTKRSQQLCAAASTVSCRTTDWERGREREIYIMTVFICTTCG